MIRQILCERGAKDDIEREFLAWKKDKEGEVHLNDEEQILFSDETTYRSAFHKFITYVIRVGAPS